MSSKQFFSEYLKYVGDTESPVIFHRWAIISAISASIGRRAYVPLGHYKIWANTFTLLIGVSGSRKDSAINIAKALMKAAGYSNFSSNKTSKEKFISDLCEANFRVSPEDEDALQGLKDIGNIRISDVESKPAECFIALGEFQDFLGQNNLDFITMLGALWDMPDNYEHRIKSGKSPKVDRPTVSILGGSTPTGFSLIFPPEIVGQGFLSRILLIYGEPTFKKIAWPTRPTANPSLVSRLRLIRTMHSDTKITLTPEAKEKIKQIYHVNLVLNDPRLVSYQSRRHIHLLKLCAILSCMNNLPTDGLVANLQTREEAQLGVVNVQNVLEANTILYYTEQRMPLALGEFGHGKYSEVSNAIMDDLNRSKKPKSIPELWKIVGHDLNTQKDLLDIMRGLQSTGKVQIITSGNMTRFLPDRHHTSYFGDEFLSGDILTDEEVLLTK